MRFLKFFTILFIVLFFGMIVLYTSFPEKFDNIISTTSNTYEDLTYHEESSFEKSKKLAKTRNRILLDDGTLLAYDKILYKAYIVSEVDDETFKRVLDDIEKIIPINRVKIKKRRSDNPYTILTYALSEKKAQEVDDLSRKYGNIALEDYEGKEVLQKILDVKISGYKRVYPLKKFLTPALGHTTKRLDENSITYNHGMGGLEGFYDVTLKSFSDVNLAINRKLQSDLENELDLLKSRNKLHEATSVILDLNSGLVKAFASSNRYEPSNIKPHEISNLNVTLIQDLFYPQKLLNPIAKLVDIQKVTKKNYLEVLDELNNIGLLVNSGIDLKNERDLRVDSNRIKINFMQLLKAYSVFYNNGVLKDFKFVKGNASKDRIIASKKLTLDIRQTLPNLFEDVSKQKFILKYKRHKRSANIKIEYIQTAKNRYLKGSFLIKK